MVKDTADVVREFNEVVNMTVAELKAWSETEESKSAGWSGSDAADKGETVGHQSATHIVDILERNPNGREEDYSDDDVAHMRKVVAYCKRHLAQEGHMVDEKSEDALKQSKSYKSLKNWGHDSLKVKHKEEGDKGNVEGDEKQSAHDEAADEEKEEKEGKDDTAETGEKRKADDEAKDDDDDNDNNGEHGEGEGEPDKTAGPDAKKQKVDDAEPVERSEDVPEDDARDKETTPKRKPGRPPKKNGRKVSK